MSAGVDDPGGTPGARFRRPWNVIDILGIPVDCVTVDDVHAAMGRTIHDGDRSLILNVNAHACNVAAKDGRMRHALRSADIVFCDGAGVQLAARILGHPAPPRITYADWVSRLAPHAAERGWSLFFLGGGPGVAEAASLRLRERYPTLRIVGTHHGFFDKAADSSQNEDVRALIADARPDVLVVGLGMPLQESWLLDNWAALDAKVGLTAGAAFDYWSGRLRRPPAWLTRRSLEWLGRLAIEPARLWKRYLIGNPLFLLRILRQRLGKRHDRPAG